MKPKSAREFLCALRDRAEGESNEIIPPFGDVVKGVAISGGLWVAYSIAFLTVPFVVTGDIVAVLLLCVLAGAATVQCFAYKRARAWAKAQRN